MQRKQPQVEKKTKKTVRFAEGSLLAQTIELPPRSSSIPNRAERSVAELSIPVHLQPRRNLNSQVRDPRIMSRPVPQPETNPRAVPNPSIGPTAGDASDFALPHRAPTRHESGPASTRPNVVSLHRGSNGFPMGGDGTNTTGMSFLDTHSISLAALLNCIHSHLDIPNPLLDQLSLLTVDSCSLIHPAGILPMGPLRSHQRFSCPHQTSGASFLSTPLAIGLTRGRTLSPSCSQLPTPVLAAPARPCRLKQSPTAAHPFAPIGQERSPMSHVAKVTSTSTTM
jgi:hypothetical protein